ncbi:MAG: aminoglycoside phosphotransferase family protein [Burkholderiaceae bacterium]
MTLAPIDKAARERGALGFVQQLQGQYGLAPETLQIASADASFRRYFRVQGGANSYIIMDAPPTHENCTPYLHVSQLFGAAGVHVPQVHAQDLEQGFLLLEDLGQTMYLPQLTESSASALYGAAFDALLKIQRASKPDELPPYNRDRLVNEMMLFPAWYLDKHLGKPASADQMNVIAAAFETIAKVALAQPAVYVHRDFHSRNLMVTQHDSPGVIDFQDAVLGPITYDLVSLLRDAYIEWPEPQQIDWTIRYWEKARAAGLRVPQDFGDFWRDFELMGLQRHLKVLGIFARLYHRDGKEGYLKDLPLVSRYTRAVLERYRVFLPLLKILDAAENYLRPTGYTF